jgi:hypothetical protein
MLGYGRDCLPHSWLSVFLKHDCCVGLRTASGNFDSMARPQSRFSRRVVCEGLSRISANWIISAAYRAAVQVTTSTFAIAN